MLRVALVLTFGFLCPVDGADWHPFAITGDAVYSAGHGERLRAAKTRYGLSLHPIVDRAIAVRPSLFQVPNNLKTESGVAYFIHAKSLKVLMCNFIRLPDDSAVDIAVKSFASSRGPKSVVTGTGGKLRIQTPDYEPVPGATLSVGDKYVLHSGSVVLASSDRAVWDFPLDEVDRMARRVRGRASFLLTRLDRIPPAYRVAVLNAVSLRQNVSLQPRDGEAEDAYASRKRAGEGIVDALRLFADGVEEVEYGTTIGDSGELNLVARVRLKERSLLLRRLSAMKPTGRKLALLGTDAMCLSATGSISCRLPTAATQFLSAFLKSRLPASSHRDLAEILNSAVGEKVNIVFGVGQVAGSDGLTSVGAWRTKSGSAGLQVPESLGGLRLWADLKNDVRFLRASLSELPGDADDVLPSVTTARRPEPGVFAEARVSFGSVDALQGFERLLDRVMSLQQLARLPDGLLPGKLPEHGFTSLASKVGAPERFTEPSWRADATVRQVGRSLESRISVGADLYTLYLARTLMSKSRINVVYENRK